MSFEETIVRCSAPSLCGIKPACLFSMDNMCFSKARKSFAQMCGSFSKQKKYFVTIKKDENRSLFFIYDRKLLIEVTGSRAERNYLKQKGYPVHLGFDAVLSEFVFRLAHNSSFPHEAGVFLGYPLKDVIGFEVNGARNYIYSGFWKVYSDKNRALTLMTKYKNCTEECLLMLKKGMSVQKAAGKFCLKNA